MAKVVTTSATSTITPSIGCPAPASRGMIWSAFWWQPFLSLGNRIMQDYEKLGVFYLGREYDLKAGKPKEDLILYDSKDLVTHAVCVGMTGSGKTGLCLALLEEAAIDHIPALVIDPKGDLSNLLLTFPKLSGKDFQPWIQESEAKKKGLKPEEYAQQQADLWKKGLAEWGQDGSRIQKLRESADYAIYTPGSNAGLPVSIMKSFDAPNEEVLGDAELFRERINTTATSLLGLLGIEADPLKSREHILLSTILHTAWKDGQNLKLESIIERIQNPPVQKIGVLNLESFFPGKDRFALAMQFNNLLAAPGFEAWLEGEPLDIDKLLWTAEGKPRMTIFSISHLGDAERMFFVSLLLNQVLGWMRAQSGTTALRAILYMDEIFGYFPPVANPPSKQPLLTLLKQARAFGLGLVLATQNPVDLDYKGLANTGTWFIGRLQTERDKMRLLDGLEGAATSSGSGFNRAELGEILSGVGNRVFLLHNVHEDHPVVFQTRWALSYLRGPLNRAQVKLLMDQRKKSVPKEDKEGENTEAPSKPAPVGDTADQRPLLPPEIPQYFVPPRAAGLVDSILVYQPRLLGSGRIYFADSKTDVDENVDLSLIVEISEEAVSVDWQDALQVDVHDSDLEKTPVEGCRFAHLPDPAARPKSYDTWKKSFADNLYRNRKLEIFKSLSLKEVSRPGETEKAFRLRLQQKAREQRDLMVEKLRAKYATKFNSLQEKIRKAEQAVAKKEEAANQSKVSAVIGFGTTVLGALLGRKKVTATTVGKAGTAMRGANKTMKDQSDVSRAREDLDNLHQQFMELDEQFKQEVAELESSLDPLTDELETIAIKPKKTNITTRLVALVWVPCWQQKDGKIRPAWE